MLISGLHADKRTLNLGGHDAQKHASAFEDWFSAIEIRLANVEEFPRASGQRMRTFELALPGAFPRPNSQTTTLLLHQPHANAPHTFELL